MSSLIQSGVSRVYAYINSLRESGLTWREVAKQLELPVETPRKLVERNGEGQTRILRHIEERIPEGWANGER